jgi:hypothetical protein
MSKWFKEPLLHFLILGGLIFYLYSLVAVQGGAADEIVVSRGQQENLINTFSLTWQRPPTQQEFEGLLDDYVRQEIAYREGQALGMDQDDIIIRRRLRQKLELLAEDVASLAVPTDGQLQEFLDENQEEFQLETRLSLHHIYFSPDRRGEVAEQDAVELLQRIGTDGPDGDLEQFGDPIPLPFQLDDAREGEIARLFGGIFTDELRGVEAGRWAGPVRSGFGWHLVFITSRVDGRVPELAEVRDAVQREWFAQRRREAVDGLYERLAENYTITVEPTDPEGKVAAP